MIPLAMVMGRKELDYLTILGRALYYNFNLTILFYFSRLHISPKSQIYFAGRKIRKLLQSQVSKENMKL